MAKKKVKNKRSSLMKNIYADGTEQLNTINTTDPRLNISLNTQVTSLPTATIGDVSNKLSNTSDNIMKGLSIGSQVASDVNNIIGGYTGIKDKGELFRNNLRALNSILPTSTESFDSLIARLNSTPWLNYTNPRDFGEKTFLEGFADAFVQGNKGFAAGMTTGNPWVAAGTATGSTVASTIGSLLGNRQAKKQSALANQEIDYIRDQLNRAFNNMALLISLSQSLDLNRNFAAFGGQLGTNGTDFSNGTVWINNGGTHEENPNEGVPYGIDQEGVPNLVEEGEVVFNNYVFSNRIKVPKDMAKKYKLTSGITFANAAKRLSKESEERPNDPISKKGLEYMMSELASSLEAVKAKKELNKFSKGGKVNKYKEGTPELSVHYSPFYSPVESLPEWLPLNPFRPLKPVEVTTLKETTPAPIPIMPTPKITISTDRNRGKSDIWNAANLRYLPVISGIGLVVSDATGFTNKPNYEPANMILEAKKEVGQIPDIKAPTIGNYLTDNPFDTERYINIMNAEANATRRGIYNTSGGNRTTAMAGAIAAGNNYLNQIGNLARLAKELNMTQSMQVGSYNKDTNKYNNDNILKAAIASAENRAKTASLSIENTAAAAKLMKEERDAAELAKSANLTNMVDNIGNIGWEEFQRNAIVSNPALLGYYLSRTGNLGYNAPAPREGKKKAKGGFLTIKKKKR